MDWVFPSVLGRFILCFLNKMGFLYKNERKAKFINGKWIFLIKIEFKLRMNIIQSLTGPVYIIKPKFLVDQVLYSQGVMFHVLLNPDGIGIEKIKF